MPDTYLENKNSFLTREIEVTSESRVGLSSKSNMAWEPQEKRLA